MTRQFHLGKLLLCVALTACVSSIGCAPASATEPVPSSPTGMPLVTTPAEEPTATIIRGLFEAINAKDKDRALSFFADEPEVYQRDAYKKGNEKIVVWLREEIDGYRDHFSVVEMKAEGARATGLVRVTSVGSESYFTASEYLFTFQATVRGGKIECLNIGQPVAGLC